MTSPNLRKIDWPDRLREVINYIGLTEDDRATIKSTGPIVRKHAVQLTNEIYDHIFNFNSASQFFVRDDGTPDPKRIQDNKDSMVQWLNYLAQAPTHDAFARYLLAVSSMHRTIPTHRPGLPSVPSQFVIGSISFYQTRLASIFQNELRDTNEASQASTAWNKILMVSLDVLLSAYLTE